MCAVQSESRDSLAHEQQQPASLSDAQSEDTSARWDAVAMHLL